MAVYCIDYAQIMGPYLYIYNDCDIYNSIVSLHLFMFYLRYFCLVLHVYLFYW